MKDIQLTSHRLARAEADSFRNKTYSTNRQISFT